MKLILRELGTFFAMIAAILLSPLILVGTIYTILKPLYDNFGIGIWKGFIKFFVWIATVVYNIWAVCKYAFLFVGYVIDLLGNVLVGELIEDFVTHKEDTLFGKGDCTISAALGQLKRAGDLNKFGLFICNVLSKLDPIHEDHCIAAIELREYKESKQVK
jgi:hypothetical protein